MYSVIFYNLYLPYEENMGRGNKSRKEEMHTLCWNDPVGQYFAAGDMFLHDLVSAFRVDVAVSHFRLSADNDCHNWLIIAFADAASLSDDHAAYIIAFDVIEDGFHRVARARCNSTGAHGYSHLNGSFGSLDFALFERFFTHAFQVFKGFDGWHGTLLFTEEW